MSGSLFSWDPLLISTAFTRALVWTLLHSLWQAAAIWALLIAGKALFRQFSAAATYNIYALALLSLCVLNGFTFWDSYTHFAASISTAVETPIAQVPMLYPNPFISAFIQFIETYTPALGLIWFVGMLLLLMKYTLDLIYCQQLARAPCTQPPAIWQERLAHLTQRLNISRPVRLGLSARVQGPCVIGHFKPIILLPLGLLSRLEPAQIEMVLLHELSHVRRNDYLITLLSHWVHCIYFFNPFVGWILQQLAREREHACDDIALSINSDKLLYAKTLAECAGMHNQLLHTNNMHGEKNMLKARIARLFMAKPKAQAKGKLVVLSTLLVSIFVWSINAYSTPDTSAEEGLSLEVHATPIKDVLALIQQSCPEIKLTLHNPEELLSLKAEALSCEKLGQLLKDFNEQSPSTPD